MKKAIIVFMLLASFSGQASIIDTLVTKNLVCLGFGSYYSRSIEKNNTIFNRLSTIGGEGFNPGFYYERQIADLFHDNIMLFNIRTGFDAWGKAGYVNTDSSHRAIEYSTTADIPLMLVLNMRYGQYFWWTMAMGANFSLPNDRFIIPEKGDKQEVKFNFLSSIHTGYSGEFAVKFMMPSRKKDKFMIKAGVRYINDFKTSSFSYQVVSTFIGIGMAW